MLKVRVGIPLTGGAMVRYLAENPALPVLFSANAFFARTADGERKLRLPKLPVGLDAALDSAGYVAMAAYGRYPWSEDEYLDLAEAYPWAFYAVPDYCVESQVASNRNLVRMRMSATVAAYYRVAAKAARRGMKAPMPVLQGRNLADYLYCAKQLPCDGLVGLGSFCRRNVHGPDGIVSIVQALAAELPKARFHLFGVKGTALDHIGAHPSVESTDSMAWDQAARCARRTGRTMEYRLSMMRQWLDKNLERKRNAVAPILTESMSSSVCLEGDDVDERLQDYLDLIEAGELDYEDATRYADHEWIGWEQIRDQLICQARAEVSQERTKMRANKDERREPIAA